MTAQLTPRAQKLEMVQPYDDFGHTNLSWTVTSQYNQLRLNLVLDLLKRSHDPMQPIANIGQRVFVSCSHNRYEKIIYQGGKYQDGEAVVDIIVLGHKKLGE